MMIQCCLFGESAAHFVFPLCLNEKFCNRLRQHVTTAGFLCVRTSK